MKLRVIKLKQISHTKKKRFSLTHKEKEILSHICVCVCVCASFKGLKVEERPRMMGIMERASKKEEMTGKDFSEYGLSTFCLKNSV